MFCTIICLLLKIITNNCIINLLDKVIVKEIALMDSKKDLEKQVACTLDNYSSLRLNNSLYFEFSDVRVFSIEVLILRQSSAMLDHISLLMKFFLIYSSSSASR